VFFTKIKLSPGFRQAAMVIVFLSISIAAYAGIMSSFFLSDDFNYLDSPAKIWVHNSQAGFFRPVVIILFLFEKVLLGLKPSGYHFISVLIHGVNASLVYLLFLRLSKRLRGIEDAAAAFFAGVLFAVLPTHPEAVSWIASQSDLFCTLFLLVSLLLYAVTRERQIGPVLWLSYTSFSISILCKETAATGVLLVLIFEWFCGSFSKNRNELYRRVLPFFLIAAVFVLVRSYWLGDLVAGYGEAHLRFGRHTWSNLTASVIAALGAPSSSSTQLSYQAFQMLIVAYAVILLGGLILRRGFFLRFQTYLWISFLTASILSINLEINPYTLRGTRYIYLATAFSSMALSSAVFSVLKSRWSAAAILLIVIAFYSHSLWNVNANWAEAGHISKTLVMDRNLDKLRGKVIFLSLPESLRGSYLFRHGMIAALKLFHGFTGEVELASYVYVDNAMDSVSPEKDGNAWRIQGNFDLSAFRHAPSVETIRITNSEFIFRVPRNLDATVLYFFSGQDGFRPLEVLTK